MKKIFVLLLVLSSVSLYAQESENYFGVRGGVNGGSIVVLPYISKMNNWGNFEWGIVYRRVSGEKWVGGIQAEASYVQTSFRLLERNESDSSFVRNLKIVEVPFMWHPTYAFGKKENFKVFFNAGPYISYITGSDYKYEDKLDPTTTYNRSGPYVFNRHLDVRIGYGIMGGAGVEMALTSRISASIEFRYKFSFSDIWKYKAKVDPAISKPTEAELEQMFMFSDYSQSQVTQMSVSFGLFYKFGKNKKKIVKYGN